VLAAFVKTFIIGSRGSIVSDIVMALLIVALFVAVRWFLPRSGLQIKVPLVGVMLWLMWLFSFLITYRHYVHLDLTVSSTSANDIGIYKDAFCLVAILFLVGMIPHLISLSDRSRAVVLALIGGLAIVALLLEFLYPQMNAGRSFAKEFLASRAIADSHSGRLCRTMLTFVTVRSFLLLLFGVVITFFVGYARMNGAWKPMVVASPMATQGRGAQQAVRP
jgi:hypothetical protein